MKKKGVKLILSTLVDGKNINGGGHKLGLGLELNAWKASKTSLKQGE